MIDNSKVSNIPCRLHNVGEGGVAGADEVIDDLKGKTQQHINAEVDQILGAGGSVDERIAAAVAPKANSDDVYAKTETYNKTELNNMITTPNQEYVTVTATDETTDVTDVLPATGEANTIYRVGNWDGTQYNDSVFSEYAWNGSAYVKLSTKSQVGEVYDISANHAGATYADLSAALGTNGANIPQPLRKGGMSVKYIHTSDNKYIQARCMAQNFTTDVTQWQGVDCSVNTNQNLVTGNGISKAFADFVPISTSALSPKSTSNGWKLSGNGYSLRDENYQMVKYQVVAGNVLRIIVQKDGDYVMQFQNGASVPAPSAGSNTLIGNVVTVGVNGLVKVPDGADYLIISKLIESNAASVEKVYNSLNVIDRTRYNGIIDSSGRFVKNETPLASNYFYSKRGSLIHITTPVSYRRIVFYNKHLDFVSEVTLTGTDYDYYLTDENIPSGAVYFRTNLDSLSYVYGEVAFGDSSSYKFINSIVLSHEFGNIPKVSSDEEETVTLTYESDTRIYINTYNETNYNLNLNNPLGIALFPAGKINIPRYSWMFIDTRVDSGDTYQCPVVANDNYTVVDDNTKHYDEDTGLYYNKVNGVKYYGKRELPGGLFIKILATGAGCMTSGPFLDSITDKRNQYIEKNINSIQQTLIYGEYTPMIPVAEQQNKVIDNSGNVVDKTDYPFNIVTYAVTAGDKYGIHAYMNNGWHYFLIYYSTDINAENIVGREDFRGGENALYVPSENSSDYYERITVPDGASYMHVNIRATEYTMNYLHVASFANEHTFSAQNHEERILRLEDEDKGSIFSLNSESEYSGLMANAKARRYDRVNSQYKDYPISLLWFSDLHANSEGVTNLKRLLSWKEKYFAYIDDVIATGDQQSLYFTDDFSYWDSNGATNVLQVIGNHDAWISKAMYQTGDYDSIVERGYGPYDSETGLYAFYIIHQKDVYDKFFKDRISGWNVTQPADAATLGKNYYYKDYNNRIRLIVLDAKHYGSPDDLDGNNQSIQDAWFTSVLADARTNNLEVVVSSHYYPRLITQNRCSWNYNYWGGNGDDKLNSLATTAVTNFINAGGTFICWMVGHTHYDDIGLITTDNNQLVIGCSTANNTRSTAFVRPTGTKLQDSFNIISFDTSDGIINILKVGGDTNNNFTRRRVLSYQYKAVTDEFGVAHQKGLIFSE